MLLWKNSCSIVNTSVKVAIFDSEKFLQTHLASNIKNYLSYLLRNTQEI